MGLVKKCRFTAMHIDNYTGFMCLLMLKGPGYNDSAEYMQIDKYNTINFKKSKKLVMVFEFENIKCI